MLLLGWDCALTETSWNYAFSWGVVQTAVFITAHSAAISNRTISSGAWQYLGKTLESSVEVHRTSKYEVHTEMLSAGTLDNLLWALLAVCTKYRFTL